MDGQDSTRTSTSSVGNTVRPELMMEAINLDVNHRDSEDVLSPLRVSSMPNNNSIHRHRMPFSPSQLRRARSHLTPGMDSVLKKASHVKDLLEGILIEDTKLCDSTQADLNNAILLLMQIAKNAGDRRLSFRSMELHNNMYSDFHKKRLSVQSEDEMQVLEWISKQYHPFDSPDPRQSISSSIGGDSTDEHTFHHHVDRTHKKRGSASSESMPNMPKNMKRQTSADYFHAPIERRQSKIRNKLEKVFEICD